ncbi:hypothetical protein HDU93_000033 [Gonapodya sp. JEL0774]|nr:hypothetical protein HDU93_000033 [Gonapodya sp. JEL0774]
MRNPVSTAVGSSSSTFVPQESLPVRLSALIDVLTSALDAALALIDELDGVSLAGSPGPQGVSESHALVAREWEKVPGTMKEVGQCLDDVFLSALAHHPQTLRLLHLQRQIEAHNVASVGLLRTLQNAERSLDKVVREQGERVKAAKAGREAPLDHRLLLSLAHRVALYSGSTRRWGSDRPYARGPWPDEKQAKANSLLEAYSSPDYTDADAARYLLARPDAIQQADVPAEEPTRTEVPPVLSSVGADAGAAGIGPSRREPPETALAMLPKEEEEDEDEELMEIDI